MNIEDEVRRLADIEAIRNQLALYGHLADGTDSEAYGALFTEDGELNVFGNAIAPRSAIVELHRANADMDKGIGHVTVNSVIEVDGDTARARSYMHNRTMTYADDWRRVDGSWLIHRREISAVTPPTAFVTPE